MKTLEFLKFLKEMQKLHGLPNALADKDGRAYYISDIVQAIQDEKITITDYKYEETNSAPDDVIKRVVGDNKYEPMPPEVRRAIYEMYTLRIIEFDFEGELEACWIPPYRKSS